MGYKDNMAYFTRKWMNDILLRENDSACDLQKDRVVKVW
jgi:hypothetical protein